MLDWQTLLTSATQVSQLQLMSFKRIPLLFSKNLKATWKEYLSKHINGAFVKNIFKCSEELVFYSQFFS